MKGQSADILVREKAFYRFARESQAIYKMVGMADMAAWVSGNRIFYEIAPTTVKKLITGNGKAGKAEVAAALECYVGTQSYDTPKRKPIPFESYTRTWLSTFKKNSIEETTLKGYESYLRKHLYRR